MLDDTLEGIKIICRESQLKYLLPMRSMCAEKMNQICSECQTSPEQLKYDEFYDTVEICSWDKGPEIGKLNIRALQILEYRGVTLDFFKKKVDEGLEWIDQLKEGGSESLLLNFKTHAIEARIQKAAGDMFDDDLVFRMAEVRVPRNEPVFAKLIDQRVRREADLTRLKVIITFLRLKSLISLYFCSIQSRSIGQISTSLLLSITNDTRPHRIIR